MGFNPKQLVTLQFVDKSAEVATCSFTALPGDVSAEVTALKTAIDAISDGVLVQETVSDITRLASQDTVGTSGQRESKWLVIYEDVTTFEVYTKEIPIRKASLEPTGQDKIPDLTVAPWAAFVTAFEALQRSPNQNQVNVLEVHVVGRNL